MSDTLWIVEGSCNEYSDRERWIECWYPTEAEAVARVLALEQVENDQADAYDFETQQLRVIEKHAGWRRPSDFGVKTYVCVGVKRGP